jgi:hypothetical protein
VLKDGPIVLLRNPGIVALRIIGGNVDKMKQKWTPGNNSSSLKELIKFFKMFKYQPLGRKSRPTIPSITEDLPALWEPT